MADQDVNTPGTQAGDDKPGQAKTFTQEDLNALIGRARIEERQKYGDYEALKAEAEEGRQLKLAQMSETERLQAQLAEVQRKAIDADGRIASAMIQSEIRVKAAQAGIVDPDAAVLLVDRTGVAYSEDGGVKGVDEALTALVVAKPYLQGRAGAANLNSGGQTAAPLPAVLTADEKEASRKLGLAEEEYTKGKRTS